MLEMEQSSESRSSESGFGSTMDLGSGLAGLGWPVVVRTDRLSVSRLRAGLPASARWEGSEDLPRVRIWAGLKTQAVLAVQTSSSGRHSTATTHFHSAGPGCKEHWRSLLSIYDCLSQFRSIQTALIRVARLLDPPKSQPLSRPPALTR